MKSDRTPSALQHGRFVALFALAALSAGCVFQSEPQPNRWGYGGTEYFDSSSAPAAPLPPAGPPQGPPEFSSSGAPAGPSVTPSISAPDPAPSAIPWGIPVEGKPGFIRSPYSPGAGQIDVRGFPPGTEIKDPYNAGKLLLVP